jgi:ribose transport system ATP-binding protein
VRGLSCRGISKRWPGVVALDEVDLDVPAGKVVVLLGENGAGKSTLAKIIAGVHPPGAGTMAIDGRPYAPSRPADALAAGVGMIHQETNLSPNLSVAENIFLGRLPTARGLVDYRALHQAARAQLERVGLDADPETPVRGLSVAARQQVEIAKALSVDARLLILDEPTAALGRAEADRLFGLIHGLQVQGVAFLYISHRLGEVKGIGDEVVVMRDGKRVAHWDHADAPVQSFVEAMVGRTVDQVYPAPPTPTDKAVLEVSKLTRRGAFADVSFSLRRGEILGIAGLVGAGRTELARTLFGAEPADSGSILLEGRELQLKSPADAVAAGIVLLPEDRKEQGLVLQLSVADNLTLPTLRRLAEGGLVRPASLRRVAGDLAQRMRLRGRLDQTARTLSGGNQQKAVIAKWMPLDPKVVIFDEPTRGIDVGARSAIYELMGELAGRGVGIILVSSDLPEVLGLSNRVLVMSRGGLAGTLEREQADEERVMSLAVGA